MVLSLLLACEPEGADSGFVEAVDTSYRGRPELQAVSASCEDGVIEFRARTIGWSNLAYVDVWMTDRVPDQYEAWELPSVAFRRDEFCDFMVVQLDARNPDLPGTDRADSKLRCPQFTANNLTFLFQVWFEEGCAGAQVFGAHPESVYANAMNGGPIVSPSNGSCVPLDASETKGVVMDEVPPCSEPLE
ncbi:hypothetical protein LBMAG42_40500 [Deltaproteobacteria bacterium]|nr:hypothetical protein LBMAG42_40500 [Deltaproteobacteria bacterium]